MGEPAVNLFVDNSHLEDEDTKTAKEKVKDTHTKEIIFALCGYLGSDTKLVTNKIIELMENSYGYTCKVIKLSEFIALNKENIASPFNAKGSIEYQRIKNLMEDGNSLRDNYKYSILAEYAINKIGLDRYNEAAKNENNQPVFKSRRICYIIDSLKHPDELELLKEVYRNLVYFIGVFSPDELRKENLRLRNITDPEILELLAQDAAEDKKYGQHVRKTFMKSDYFLRLDNSSKHLTSQKLERFIHLIFETAIITPTKDEIAMYFAFSASFNSACLSRQVGASIVNENGELLSVGWNDVPQYDGNLYGQRSSTDTPVANDFRCLNFSDGQCMNDHQKDKISQSLLNDLVNNGCVSSEKSLVALQLIKNSRLGSLIEFSRAIHAEMHAIVIGSQKFGDKMIGGRLYVTTYPCHNCARHIVLAGIKEVYYIEPYLKSLATTLHSDSITENENDSKKVKILLYDGVAPTRYHQLFKMRDDSRKYSNGKVVKLKQRDSAPKFSESLRALYSLESLSSANIANYNLKVLSSLNESKE